MAAEESVVSGKVPLAARGAAALPKAVPARLGLTAKPPRPAAAYGRQTRPLARPNAAAKTLAMAIPPSELATTSACTTWPALATVRLVVAEPEAPLKNAPVVAAPIALFLRQRQPFLHTGVAVGPGAPAREYGQLLVASKAVPTRLGAVSPNAKMAAVAEVAARAALPAERPKTLRRTHEAATVAVPARIRVRVAEKGTSKEEALAPRSVVRVGPRARPAGEGAPCARRLAIGRRRAVAHVVSPGRPVLGNTGGSVLPKRAEIAGQTPRVQVGRVGVLLTLQRLRAVRRGPATAKAAHGILRAALLAVAVPASNVRLLGPIRLAPSGRGLVRRARDLFAIPTRAGPSGKTDAIIIGERES